MSLYNVGELKEALLGSRPDDFVSAHLFEPVPHLFDGNMTLWIEWKTHLAKALEIDAREIVLTGSAALGYSLNPSKRLAHFHGTSDIDVAVISGHHFDLAWRYLRRSSPTWLSLPKGVRTALQSHRNNYVFSGTIATDRILPMLPFAKAWQTALDEMGLREPTRGRDVNLRIYRDYEALRAYQATNIEVIRNGLLDAKDDDIDILTEDA